MSSSTLVGVQRNRSFLLAGGWCQSMEAGSPSLGESTHYPWAAGEATEAGVVMVVDRTDLPGPVISAH